jgi:hypothetical protein
MADPGRAELLLERDRELESLRAALADAADGDGRLALVEGPAGIGKSRLLAELRAAATEEDVRVLAARGSELEREFPFGVVRRLFESPLTDAELRERWLAGAAEPARAIFDVSELGADGIGADASFAALHGLYWLTANVAADGPLSRPRISATADDADLIRPLTDLCPEMSTFAMVPPNALGYLAMDPDAPMPYAGSSRLISDVSSAGIDAFVETAGPAQGRRSRTSSCARSAARSAAERRATVPARSSTATT